MDNARFSVLRIFSLAFGLVILAAWLVAGQQPPPTPQGKTADQVYKNLEVLKKIPADQLIQSMHVIKASVGLDCVECHVDGDFPADEKKPKIIARQMMRMVLALNKNSFEGKPEITCYTCHRGSPHPVVFTALLPVPTEPIEPTDVKIELPSVDHILAKYVEALGGEETLRRVKSRVIIGTEDIPTGPGGGVPMPALIERDMKPPNLVLNIYHTPNYRISDGFDGSTQWSKDANGEVTEAGRLDQERAERAADFYEPLDLKKEYSAGMTVSGIEKVDGRDAYVVVGYPQGDLPEQLYFDTLTGLLLRKRTILQTPVGNSPFQITYSDYRDTGSGVQFPFLIKMDPAGPRTELSAAATIHVTSVEDNLPIADSKFAKPALPMALSYRP